MESVVFFFHTVTYSKGAGNILFSFYDMQVTQFDLLETYLLYTSVGKKTRVVTLYPKSLFSLFQSICATLEFLALTGASKIE